MAAQIMTEEVFWRLKPSRRNQGCLLLILQECAHFVGCKQPQLWTIFRLKKWLRRCQYHLSVCWEESSLGSIFFLYWRSVRCWQVCILSGNNFKLVLMTFLMVFLSTSISRAIFLMDLCGLRLIRTLTALTGFGVRALHSLPLRGRSAAFPSSLNPLTVWWTVDLGALISFTISEFV